MTSPSESEGQAPTQRLHPAALLFSVASSARRLLLPGIVLLVLSSRGGFAQVVLMLMFVPAVVGGLLRYMTYRYRLGPDEMIVREGVVTRNERHIPYSRIQNINLRQNPLHRWLGVSEVRLETASGEKPEAVMSALSLEAIETLRTHVFQGRDTGSPPDEPAADGVAPPIPDQETRKTVLELGPRELVLFGLISNKGLAVVAAAMGLIWQFDFGVEEYLEEIPHYWTQFTGMLPGRRTTAMLLAVGIPVAFVALKLFSVIWAILKFYGFRLSRVGDDLRAEYGLFTRISATIPRRRVQRLGVRSRPIHRWLARSTMQVQTAGSTGDGDEGSAVDRLWLAPLLPEAEVEPLVREIFPEIELNPVEWRPVAARARGRLFRVTAFLSVLPAVASAFLIGWWAISVLLVGVGVGFVSSLLYVRHTRYALTDTAVLYRSGWWVRSMTIVRFNKIQAVSLQASPFDRRLGMACVRVDTAGAGRLTQQVDIRFLETEVAVEMADRLFDAAGRTRFQW